MSKHFRETSGLESHGSYDEIKDVFPDAEPQEDFALFRLPLETRWAIYELIFGEVEVPDGRYMEHIGETDFEDTSLESSTHVNKIGKKVPYWIRPDCTARVMVWTDFLQTCKWVY